MQKGVRGRLLWAGAAILALATSCRPGGDEVQAFLDAHWIVPLPAQGAPPPGRPALEASLGADDCGHCHSAQHADWHASRHAQTMRAGILWQFDVFDQYESNRCMQCHAPLAEQKALIALERTWPDRPASAPPGYIPPDLHRQGLTCAACHVRAHVRHGPPSVAGVRPDAPELPHGGFVASAAFGDSRFCSLCHQFPDDGPRLAGKLRQDTYNEWRASRHATAGTTCQQCHMPDRRHLWRGIGDAEMVRSALSVDLRAAPRDSDRMYVRATLVNTGAGHRFPTYLVPRVDVRLWLQSPDGERTLLAEHVIQWRASVDLEIEYFDQRLAVDEGRVLEGTFARPPMDGWRAVLAVEVAPKEHYERTYRHMLEQSAQMGPKTVALLRQALEEAEASRFLAFESSIPIQTPPIR